MLIPGPTEGLKKTLRLGDTGLCLLTMIMTRRNTSYLTILYEFTSTMGEGIYILLLQLILI